ncbi:MAG TPA: hypothetical protein VJ783_14130 [Pirellulales bacterium]|nr:hypothetical protein [Pirellulales bacterium]
MMPSKRKVDDLVAAIGFRKGFGRANHVEAGNAAPQTAQNATVKILIGENPQHRHIPCNFVSPHTTAGKSLPGEAVPVSFRLLTREQHGSPIRPRRLAGFDCAAQCVGFGLASPQIVVDCGAIPQAIPQNGIDVSQLESFVPVDDFFGRCTAVEFVKDDIQ